LADDSRGLDKQSLTHNSSGDFDSSIGGLCEVPALGIAICDDQLRYVAVNKALAAMNGIPAEAHIGKTLREVIGPIAQSVELILRYVLFSGRSTLNCEISGELPTRNEEGSWIANYFPIRDSIGEVKRVGILVTEITKLRRLEQCILALLGSMSRTRGQITQLGVPYGLEKERLGFWRGSIETVENSVLEMLAHSHSLQLPAQTPNTGDMLTHERVRPPSAPKTISNGPHGQEHRSIPVGNNRAVPLSPRETEVVQLLAGGKSNKEISTALNISVKTVETYRGKIMLKLQLHSTGDLVMHAVRHGIVKV
jgi:DNA-binding CsgD family transcriptional regulator